MKQLLIGTFALFFATTMNAQPAPASMNDASETTAEAPKASLSTKSNATAPAATVFITAANQWQHIEMKTSGDRIYFTNIDGLSALKVHITNAEGAEQMQLKVSSSANAVNCKKLKPGLYFVTLLNENTDEKRAFTLSRE